MRGEVVGMDELSQTQKKGGRGACSVMSKAAEGLARMRTEELRKGYWD